MIMVALAAFVAGRGGFVAGRVYKGVRNEKGKND